jgi:hypothetical protein
MIFNLIKAEPILKSRRHQDLVYGTCLYLPSANPWENYITVKIVRKVFCSFTISRKHLHFCRFGERALLENFRDQFP